MGGTNLLVRDGGIEGIVVRLVRLDRIEEPEAGVLYAEGGVLMPRLLKFAMQRGLTAWSSRPEFRAPSRDVSS